MSPFHSGHWHQALQVTLTELPDCNLLVLLNPRSSTDNVLEAEFPALSLPFMCPTGTRALWAEVGKLGPRNSSVEVHLPFFPFHIYRRGAKPSSHTWKGQNPSFLLITPLIANPAACSSHPWSPLLRPWTHPIRKLYKCKHKNIAWSCPHLFISMAPATHISWFCLWDSPVSPYVYM